MIQTPRRPRFVLLASALAAAWSPASPALAQARFSGLGALPGATDSSAVGVSADGLVVAGNSGGRAFRWSAAGGMLALRPGGNGEVASGISDDGSTVVGYYYSPWAFRWTNATGMQGLAFPLGADGLGSVASCVSANGAVVAGYWEWRNIDESGLNAFGWTGAGGMQNLGWYDFSYSFGNGISADGSVIVGDHGNRACVWTAAGGGSLPLLPGASGASASDVSSNGMIVTGTMYGGGGSSESSWTQMFRRTGDGGLEYLGSPSAGREQRALGISGDGAVVVGSSRFWVPSQGYSDFRAILWTGELGSVDLQSYLSTLGADLTGWTIAAATNVSADGRTIVGNGTHNGVNEAWVATLTALCPADRDGNGRAEPADIALFINQWFTSLQNGTLAGDFDGNGHVQPADVSMFVSVWFAALQNGC